MSTPKRRKVLIISYLFPPAGGVAVQRALSLAKYLPALGFEVHVLRARNAATPVIDRSLLQHIPASVRVHHAISPEPRFAFRQRVWGWLSAGKSPKPAAASATSSKRGWKSVVTDAIRRIFCPEPEVLWVPFATRKARRIIRRHDIDTVMVTAPPFSAFLVGIRLKRELPNLKLISDFRDSWLGYYASTYDLLKNVQTRKRAEEIERMTVELSDFVVTVTRSTRTEIRTRYPEQPEEKFVCIPNGYDPEVFAGLQQEQHEKRLGAKIVVANMGTVAPASSPTFFLDALEAMPEQIQSEFEMHFIGRVANSEQVVLESRKIHVKLLGFMPQAKALQELAKADYALVVMTDAASVPGKIYEYLATGKPILAVAPLNGEVAQVLRETGAGWCADPRDREGLMQMIQTAYDVARRGSDQLKRNPAAIRKYERPRLAAEYGRLLDGPRREMETEVIH